MVLLLLMLSFQSLVAARPVQSHVVPVEELQGQLTKQSAERMQNIREIQEFLRHDSVQQHVGTLADLERIEAALTSLNDETLSQLASESRKINDGFQAGLPRIALIFIIICLAVGVAAVIMFAGD
jgi:hypothetical protein